MEVSDDLRECLSVLRRDGLLLKSDPKFPSVTTVVARGPVHGSWWTHAAANAIVKVLEQLASHPDILLVKLVDGKDTFVHRRLWPELLAVATSKEPWQLRGLSNAAEALYREVMDKGEIEGTGDDVKTIETRLLVRAEQFHSERGHHKKRLESWAHWMERTGVDVELPSVALARRAFENVLPGAKWPWTPKAIRSAAPPSDRCARPGAMGGTPRGERRPPS